MSRHRTFLATLLGCSVIFWDGSAWSQAAPAAGVSAAAGNMDAASAVSNSASLPPPAPLPQSTMSALGDPASGMPSLPPAAGGPPMPPLPPVSAQPQMPALPSSSSVPTAGPVAPAIQGQAAPLVTLPSLPTSTKLAPPPGAPPAPLSQNDLATVNQFQTQTQLAPAPGMSQTFAPDKPIVPSNSAPIVMNASGAPVLPKIPDQEIMSLQRHPLPRLAPDSPLIPGPSLAETSNQRRQVTTLPGSGGDTSYAYATLGGFNGPAAPMTTPPSIVETKPGHDIGKNYPPLQAVLPQPNVTPGSWDEPGSAFGTPSPVESLNYYVSKTMRKNPDMVDASPSQKNMEVIVLRGGQEFQGLILERGEMWRVELGNGTVITVPAVKVSHIRKRLAVPTSTPVGRSQVFLPQPLYREEMTN